jgi:hypothetical protein
MAGSDWWTKVATVATLIASLVALGVVTVPPLWRRWWSHPKIEVIIDAKEPWTRNPLYLDQPTTSVFLRAEVTNRGRAEAKNVLAVVQDWYERPDSTARWERRDLDPSALHWVSLPWGHRKHADNSTEARETAPAVNLPPGLSDFVDLISYAWDKGVHALALDNDRPRGFALNPSTAEGEFVLTVVIVADNARSLTTYIHYAISGAEPFLTGVQLQSRPPPDPQFSSRLAKDRAIRAARNGDGEQAHADP